MEPKALARLTRNVEAKMRLAYRLHGRRIFWPEQFVGDDCVVDDVLRVFKRMEADGEVELVVDAICQDGHRIWSGPPEKLIEVPLDYCGSCEDPNDVEIHTEIRAEITSEWADELRQEDAIDQKKVSLCRM